MKKLTSLLLAMAMVMSLAACGSKEEPAPAPAPTPDAPVETPAEPTGDYEGLDDVVLMAGDNSGVGAACQLFGELVTAKVDEITGGKLTVEYFPNSELGGDADLMRQVQAGDLDFVVCQTAPTVSFIPEMAVFDLPMVFAKYDGDKIDSVLNGDNEFTQKLNDACGAVGFRMMGHLQNATYRLTTSHVELKDLAAFKGLQIRTMENANHMAFWTAIGAEPTPLAWAEVYFALQSGTIDAQENAADTCASANFQEVQKYLSCTNHILYNNVILMNADKYEALDPAYQAALDQAVAEAIAELRPQLADLDASNKAKLEEGGMTITEYEPSFYDEILALDTVKALYEKIDADVNGLGTALQAALEA